MDLNELLHAHQLEVMKASASNDDSARQGHFVRVALYAERIRQLRESHHKPDTGPPRGSRPEKIDGVYAGMPAGRGRDKLDAWENEGGALYPPDEPLPVAITTRLVREYRVGPYVYQDRALAMAEYKRQS